MGLIQILAKAIGKIWSFTTTMFYIVIAILFVFSFATVIAPNNVRTAIELIVSYLT